MKRWIFLFLLIGSFAALISFTTSGPSEVAADSGEVEYAVGTKNPASTYCTEVMGYEYEIVTEVDGGQVGNCILPDGQKCDQWDFYAGVCGADYSYCAANGMGLETKADGLDPFSPEYAVCVGSDGARRSRSTPSHPVPSAGRSCAAAGCPR